MRTAIASLLALCISLWLGGLVALVLFVSSLFAFDRPVAVNAAPILFRVFERYQIGLAVATLAALILWQVLGRSKLKLAALVATAIATALAVLQIEWITPTINATRGVDPAKFDQFHHLATKNYTTITLFVALAGALSLLATRTAPPVPLPRGEVR